MFIKGSWRLIAGLGFVGENDEQRVLICEIPTFKDDSASQDWQVA